MESVLVPFLVVVGAALPVLVGLYRVHMKNGINAKAFTAVCSKLLQEGNPERFQKLLRANETPLTGLVRHAWRNRVPPEARMSGFDGYRAAERPPTYLERLGPQIKPEVERVRATYLRAWLWTLPAFAAVPILFVVSGSPRANAPWIIAAVMCLLSLGSFITVMGQRGDVHTTLAQLVPLFERYAERP